MVLWCRPLYDVFFLLFLLRFDRSHYCISRTSMRMRVDAMCIMWNVTAWGGGCGDVLLLLCCVCLL